MIIIIINNNYDIDNDDYNTYNYNNYNNYNKHNNNNIIIIIIIIFLGGQPRSQGFSLRWGRGGRESPAPK